MEEATARGREQVAIVAEPLRLFPARVHSSAWHGAMQRGLQERRHRRSHTREKKALPRYHIATSGRAPFSQLPSFGNERENERVRGALVERPLELGRRFRQEVPCSKR